MTADKPYQFLPDLSIEEYALLEDDIRANGVEVAVVVDENGDTLDGHYRREIADRLGIDYARDVRSGLTEEEKRRLALTLNTNRRNLNREQKRALVAESLRLDPQLSDRKHSRLSGVDHKTVASVRAELEWSGAVGKFPTRIGADGVEQRATKPLPINVTEKKVGGGSIIVDPMPMPIPPPVQVPEVDPQVSVVNFDAETPSAAPIPGLQTPAAAKDQFEADKQSEKADRKAQRAAWMADNKELTKRNAELAKTNAELTKKITKARENLGVACKQVAELKAELAERDQLVAELREALKLARAKASPGKAPAPANTVERVVDGIVRHLVCSGGRAAWSDVRTNAFSGADRKYFDAAVERLVTAGRVEVITVGRGRELALLAAADTEKAS